MGKLVRAWRVSIELAESEEGSYSTKTLGSTTIRVPASAGKKVGAIVQAHVEAIDASVADVDPIEREPTFADTEIAR